MPEDRSQTLFAQPQGHGSLTVRVMRDADLDAAAALSSAAFGVPVEAEQHVRRWRERVEHPMRTDPAGAFVAELDGRLVGVAEAIRRERLWCLSLLAAAPDAQSVGAGRALLRRALRYGADAPAGLIASSNDPRALRLYALHGFSLRPTFDAEGTLLRRALPRERAQVTEVDPGELETGVLEAFAEVSRDVRGGPHTQELMYMHARGGRILRVGDRGFAVVEPRRVALLAARDEEGAGALLWAALERADSIEGIRVRWITGEQQWALRILARAGLRFSGYGALGVRGDPGTLSPFLPSAPFA